MATPALTASLLLVALLSTPRAGAPWPVPQRKASALLRASPRWQTRPSCFAFHPLFCPFESFSALLFPVDRALPTERHPGATPGWSPACSLHSESPYTDGTPALSSVSQLTSWGAVEDTDQAFHHSVGQSGICQGHPATWVQSSKSPGLTSSSGRLGGITPHLN